MLYLELALRKKTCDIHQVDSYANMSGLVVLFI